MSQLSDNILSIPKEYYAGAVPYQNNMISAVSDAFGGRFGIGPTDKILAGANMMIHGTKHGMRNIRRPGKLRRPGKMKMIDGQTQQIKK